MSALVVTYHAIEEGPGPLFVAPDLFQRHLDTIRDSGAKVVTLTSLGEALRKGELPERTVAITFDDAFASVARVAAPLLLERGFTATVFCVAGYVGGANDWPSQPDAVPRKPLTTADELRDLAGKGFELGAHGMTHRPLSDGDEDELRREIVESRTALERLTGTDVRSFAYPYGAAPSTFARGLVANEYRAACTTELRLVGRRDDALALPRVDAYYVRRPQLLHRALEGSLGAYLHARSAAAGVRRRLTQEHVR